MASDRKPDFPGAIDFAKRLNATEVNGIALGAYTLLGRFSFTPFYTNAVIFGLQPSAASAKKPPARKRGIFLSLLIDTFLHVLKVVVLRPKVWVYSIDKVSSSDKDHDMRMHTLYASLKDNGVRFSECLHTIPFSTYQDNKKIRGRSALYTEGVSLAARLFVKIFPQKKYRISETDAEIARYLSARMKEILQNEWEIRIWTLLIKMGKPKAIFAIDDMRSSAVLTAAAEQADVPLYLMQHGHYTKYHFGYLHDGYGMPPVPAGLIVWSEYWKKQLLKLGTYIPEDRIIVGGLNNALPELKSPKPKIDGELTVLIPYETAADKEYVRRYIAEILKDESAHVYFKVRRDVAKDRQIEEYGIEESSRLSCIDDHEPYLDQIDVVAGTYSTYLYDMVAYGIPVAILKTDSEFGEGMIQNGLAKEVELGSVVDGLKKIAGTSEQEREEKRNMLFGTLPIPLSSFLRELYQKLGILAG